MDLYNVIPENLFSPLASKNKSLYYRYATHVRKVFDKIAFQISRKFYARTKRKLEPVHIKIASKIIARVRFPKYRTSSLS